jgi:hypothetical protein
MVIFFQILTGIGMLFFGRKFFWFFVAGVGFIAAATWASGVFAGESDFIVLLIALAAGVIGALIAMFVRWLGIGLAGFVGGGYLVFSILGLFGLDLGIFSWAFYIIGGIIGAILFAIFFDWTLIILSSLSGAVILSQIFFLPRMWAILLIAVLFIIGVIVQARVLSAEKG